MSNTLKQEIFAVGKWNGFDFTLNDLRKMKASFESLKSVLKVPLKLGHNDEQPVLDGQPALGWIESVDVDEAQTPPKLVAEFSHVPDVMVQAFEKKLYRSVSIELDFDVQHKGSFYDFVITAVALLGADIPAVNVLNDLGALMSKHSNMPQRDFVVGEHATFKAIFNKESEMDDVQKLKSELAAAQAAATTATANFEALQLKYDAEKTANDERFARIEAGQKAEKATAARSKFKALIEDAVKDERITPAQRESYNRVLKLDDDDAVLSLKESDITDLIGEPKAANFNRGGGATQTGGDTDDDPGEVLTQKAYALMEKQGNLNFTRALEVVMKANPQLAEQYRDSNGVKVEARHA